MEIAKFIVIDQFTNRTNDQNVFNNTNDEVHSFTVRHSNGYDLSVLGRGLDYFLRFGEFRFFWIDFNQLTIFLELLWKWRQCIVHG